MDNEIEKLKQFLQKKASSGKHLSDEEYDINSASGGNIDDAYSYGQDDGEVDLAQHILDTYFSK